MTERRTVKNLPTDRHRTPHAFVETRTGAYYGKLGYLAGQGRSCEYIAAQMGDGIHPSYVRTLLTRWGFPRPQAYCQVPLTFLQRQWLEHRAEKEAITPEEWLRRRVAAAVLTWTGD